MSGFFLGTIFGLVVGGIFVGVIVQGYYIDAICDLEKFRRSIREWSIEEFGDDRLVR